MESKKETTRIVVSVEEEVVELKVPYYTVVTPGDNPAEPETTRVVITAEPEDLGPV